MLQNQSIAELIKRELVARDVIKTHLQNSQPFQRDLHALDSLYQGALPLGYTLPDRIPFRLNLDKDTRLMSFLGMPGKGKTHSARLLALMCMKLGIRVKSFTRKISEFQDLLSLQYDYYDLGPQDIRLNPFIPPTKKISQDKWNGIIASTFQSDFWLTYASGINLAHILDQFHNQYPNSIITPSKLLQFIESGKRKQFRKLDVDEKVINRLFILTTGPGKEIFDSNEVIDFQFYAQSNINFSLTSLNTVQLLSFIAIFITMLIQYKRQNNSTLRDCIILDDYSEFLKTND